MSTMTFVLLFFAVLLLILALLFIFNSIKLIGPTEVGLVTKRIGKRLPDDNPIALRGEAGYQADLLMPGLRFRWWPVHTNCAPPSVAAFLISGPMSSMCDAPLRRRTAVITRPCTTAAGSFLPARRD